MYEWVTDMNCVLTSCYCQPWSSERLDGWQQSSRKTSEILIGRRFVSECEVTPYLASLSVNRWTLCISSGSFGSTTIRQWKFPSPTWPAMGPEGRSHPHSIRCQKTSVFYITFFFCALLMHQCVWVLFLFCRFKKKDVISGVRANQVLQHNSYPPYLSGFLWIYSLSQNKKHV